MPRIIGNDVARFWSYVEKTEGCWIWIGCLDTAGYGQININGKMRMAHRYSYELTRGTIEGDALCCHTCDNRRCVRPDHIFLGDHATNAANMVAKRRQATGDRNGTRLHPESRPRGERNPKAKLTEDQVREIRRRRAAGEGIRALGREFGVGHSTIWNIVHGWYWTHVM